MKPCGTTPLDALEKHQGIFENLRREYHRRGDHDGQRAMEFALERLRLMQSETTERHFIAPSPLPQELVAVLIHYDKITVAAPATDHEWDFVMTARDWRELRDFFAKLKPGGPPKVIVSPPRPA